jgi:glycine/D-amino acid oxidase-like deaminating enzyme
MTSTVILGSGIIGLATAYHLADHQPGSTIHLVDASPRLFASASGFAGGFVARDWFQPACAALGALSFAEHRRLAQAFDGAARWGYSPSVTVSYDPGASRPTGGGVEDGEDWLAAPAASRDQNCMISVSFSFRSASIWAIVSSVIF